MINSERRSRQPREVLSTLSSTSPTTEPTAARTAERTSVNDEKPEDVNEAIVRPWYEAVAQRMSEEEMFAMIMHLLDYDAKVAPYMGNASAQAR